MITALEIKQNIHDWETVLKNFGVSDEYLTRKHGPCPVCGGNDRFRYDNKYGNGDYFCNKCGAGDGLSLIQKVNDWDFSTTTKELISFLGLLDKPRSSCEISKYKLEIEKKRYIDAVLYVECFAGTKDNSTLRDHEVKKLEKSIDIVRNFRLLHANYLDLCGI